MIIDYQLNNPNGVSILDKAGNIIKTIQILPGMNEIPDVEWELAKKQLSNFHLSKIREIGKAEKKIEVIEKDEDSGKEKKKLVETNKTYTDLDIEVAVDVVKKCWKVKDLENWKKNENRSEVRNAIDEQLNAIKEGKKKKDNE